MVEDNRWFNSAFGRRAGLGVLLFGLGLGIAGCARGCGDADAARTIAEAKAETISAETVYKGDLDGDGNGNPDEFHIINGQIAPIRMNGKPVMSYFPRGTNDNYTLGKSKVEVSER